MLPSLSALRAFEAAAAHGSMQRAAAELHVTPTAVTHQVRALERELNVELFVRRPRQLALTPVGARLFEALREGFDTMAAGVRAVRQPEGPRTVTLSTTPAFAARWVLPRLQAFHAAHPQVALRLHASEAVVELGNGVADLAIRFGDGRWPGLATQPLGEECYAVMCGRGVRLRRPQDLDRLALIHFDWGPTAKAPATWVAWAREAGIPQPSRWVAARTRLSFTDETHAMNATLAGLGVGLLSLTLTAQERASGLLVQPFGPTLSVGGFHLATPQGHEMEDGIREVWAWMAMAG